MHFLMSWTCWIGVAYHLQRKKKQVLYIYQTPMYEHDATQGQFFREV